MQIMRVTSNAATPVVGSFKMLETSESATIVDFTKHVSGKREIPSAALVTKSVGTTLYLTRDIGALFD
jgi:arginyl-tRNA synthetase